MTVGDWRKVLKQLKTKPAKMKKYIKHNSPKDRSVGRRKIKCSYCGRFGGHVSKYGLDFCRHCFREIAPKIGFKKYN